MNGAVRRRAVVMVIGILVISAFVPACTDRDTEGPRGDVAPPFSETAPAGPITQIVLPEPEKQHGVLEGYTTTTGSICLRFSIFALGVVRAKLCEGSLQQLLGGLQLLTLAPTHFTPSVSDGSRIVVESGSRAEPPGALIGAVTERAHAVDLYHHGALVRRFELGPLLTYDGMSFHGLLLLHPVDFDTVVAVDAHGSALTHRTRDEISQL